MESDKVGRKFLWGAPGGVVELHGQEKRSWTHLADHLFRNGVAADDLLWEQNQNTDTTIGNRLVFHALRFMTKVVFRETKRNVLVLKVIYATFTQLKMGKFYTLGFIFYTVYIIYNAYVFYISISLSDNSFDKLEAWIGSYFTDDNIFAFFTDFYYELEPELGVILGSFGFDTSTLDRLIKDSNERKYAAIAGVFNVKEQITLSFASRKLISG